MAKSGGLFECEYCGMQYDKTRIQEMVQEIKGTVKVEGTVQVSGTVKLDGPVKVEDSVETQKLLRHGWLAIEDEDWDKASAYFDRVLEREPESGEAYFGKFHSRYKCQRGQHNQIGLRKMNPALSAEAKNVKAINGLGMLVFQGISASPYWGLRPQHDDVQNVWHNK